MCCTYACCRRDLLVFILKERWTGYINEIPLIQNATVSYNIAEMMSAIITLCLVIFTFQSLGSSDHSNLIDSSNKLNATALDGNSRPSTTTDEKNCTHETDPYSSDHSSRPPFQDNFIRSFTSAPLLPVGECGEALQLSKLKFRATGIARQCLNRGRCRLSKEGRLQSLKSEIRKLVGLSLSNWNNHDDIESDSEVILSRKYSGEDWKYLRNWDEMEKSSVFFGHPTLRFRLKSVFKTSAVSLQSMPPTASPSKYSDASRISNDLSGALHNINDLNPAFTVDLVGTSSSRSSDQTCPVIHASGNSRGVRMDRVLVNELNVCAPRSDTFASHLSDLIGSGFQDAKKSASRCLLPLSTDTDLTPFPDLRMSLPLSGDERLVTFLEPLGHGAEAEVWRVCISGSRAGVKDTSAQFAALKVYRRQFRYPRHPRSSSLGEERGQKIDPIPPFNETWDKAVGSLNEAVGSARLLPQSVALLPLSIWDVGSKGFFHVTTERYSAISRYSVYLGYAAAFDIADEVGSPYCSQHISDFMIFQDLESFTLRQAGGTVAIEEIKVIGRSLVQ